MSRAISRRIDSINQTARRVVAGDLSERVPTSGSSDDFDKLAETLNAMLDRMQTLLISMRRVSDTVAHELRTPLTRLHADLSDLRSSISLEGRPLVDLAVAEAEKVIGLFDAVLRIGRIESIQELSEIDRIELSQLLTDLVETFGPSSEENRIELVSDIERGLAVPGNSNLVFQALGNVIDNAIKYAPVGGRVEISARAGQGRVCVVISDNGRGIPLGQRENVFERFVRLPRTSHIPGLGLGLSFARAVAETHKALLTLEDANPGLRVTWCFQRIYPAANDASPIKSNSQSIDVRAIQSIRDILKSLTSDGDVRRAFDQLSKHKLADIIQVIDAFMLEEETTGNQREFLEKMRGGILELWSRPAGREDP